MLVRLVLLRLHRTLSILEETLLTADEAIREVVPEVRDSLSNVNDISAGVNVVLRSAGGGANRLKAAPIFIANGKTIEEIFDSGETGVREVSGAARPNPLQELQRRRERVGGHSQIGRTFEMLLPSVFKF